MLGYDVARTHRLTHAYYRTPYQSLTGLHTHKTSAPCTTTFKDGAGTSCGDGCLMAKEWHQFPGGFYQHADLGRWQSRWRRW